MGSRPTGLGGLLQHGDPKALWYQTAEIVVGRTYLRHGVTVGPGDTVLDVGANLGVASAFFAHVCGAATVHGFEPVGQTFDLLCRNVAQFPACIPHQCGMGDHDGEAEITYYPEAPAMSGIGTDPERDRAHFRSTLLGAGISPVEADERSEASFAHPRRLTCRLRTVSSFLRSEGIRRVDLLKVDVEGAELAVLNGVDEEDWPVVRQVAVEAHSSACTEAAVELLERRGFRVEAEQDPIRAGSGVTMLYGVRG